MVKPLSISVAVAAAIALAAGITKRGVDVLGLAADLTLLGIGAVGLMLALTTLRSPPISPFLRVFSTIFAVEHVVTGLAYVAVQAGWWPVSFSELMPPAFSLLLVAGSEMLRLRLGLAVGLDVFIAATAVILALGGPLMIGILLEEGVCAVRIWREAARWRTRAISP